MKLQLLLALCPDLARPNPDQTFQDLNGVLIIYFIPARPFCTRRKTYVHCTPRTWPSDTIPTIWLSHRHHFLVVISSSSSSERAGEVEPERALRGTGRRTLSSGGSVAGRGALRAERRRQVVKAQRLGQLGVEERQARHLKNEQSLICAAVTFSRAFFSSDSLMSLRVF